MKYISIFICLTLYSCGIEELIIPLDAREKYEKTLFDNERVTWNKLSDEALKDRVYIELPYKEIISIDTVEAIAAGYLVHIQQGSQLNIELNSTSVFIDIYKIHSDSIYKREAFYEPKDVSDLHIAEIEESNLYLIRVQPKLKVKQELEINLRLQPIYQFPVAGGKNADIGSFWGDPRDGGRRKHKGIDIFAKKGSPLLAVTNSSVRSVRNRGLGGKQIWLNDSKRKINIYYAHLDSQYVKQGQLVKRGDTIGTVGNTGNARTTPPHLHFGIYQHFSGAIDPLKYVKLIKNRTFDPNTNIILAGLIFEISTTKANFRPSPSTKSNIISSLQKGQKVKIIGVVGNWYHVRDENGRAGYIYKSNLSQLS